jgi:hypothetical protein
MEDRRITPLAGLVSVVLFVIGVFVIESASTPGDRATGVEIAQYFDDELYSIAIGMLLWGVGTIALIWFLDGLRTHILPASAQFARLAYGFGFAVALLMLASFGPDIAAAIATDNKNALLTPGAAEAMHDLGDGFFVAAEFLLAGFYFTVGLVSLRTRVLPAWLGGASLILAVVALIPPIGWATLVFGLPLWILVVSALLWRRANSVPAESV